MKILFGVRFVVLCHVVLGGECLCFVFCFFCPPRPSVTAAGGHIAALRAGGMVLISIDRGIFMLRGGFIGFGGGEGVEQGALLSHRAVCLLSVN